MKNNKVLVIDDEEDFRFLMTEMLKRKGCRVWVANSLSDGLKLLQSIRPDFVFLDNNLPDGLGWSKTEFILSNYPNANLNLISAFDVPKTSSSSFRILYKPIISEELNKMFN
jgi:CheY-like chemotaxis protein